MSTCAGSDAASAVRGHARALHAKHTADTHWAASSGSAARKSPISTRSLSLDVAIISVIRFMYSPSPFCKYSASVMQTLQASLHSAIANSRPRSTDPGCETPVLPEPVMQAPACFPSLPCSTCICSTVCLKHSRRGEHGSLHAVNTAAPRARDQDSKQAIQCKWMQRFGTSLLHWNDHAPRKSKACL